jgi:hypothetical protein
MRLVDLEQSVSHFSFPISFSVGDNREKFRDRVAVVTGAASDVRRPWRSVFARKA